MRSFIRNFILIVAVLMVGKAYAAEATWALVGDWTIKGNSDTQACAAIVDYESGRRIGIVFAEDTASLAVSGLDVTEGDVYTSFVAASTGKRGVYHFYATSPTTVVVTEINEVSVKALMNASELYIEGLGRFSLKGSKAAMHEAWACYQALNSF